jgi:hypothetical protein
LLKRPMASNQRFHRQVAKAKSRDFAIPAFANS